MYCVELVPQDCVSEGARTQVLPRGRLHALPLHTQVSSSLRPEIFVLIGSFGDKIMFGGEVREVSKVYRVNIGPTEE